MLYLFEIRRVLINKDYEGMSLIELKVLAKELGIKNISKLKKSELIEEIKATEKKSPISIEKDGMLLTEKIIPKKSVEEKNETYFYKIDATFDGGIEIKKHGFVYVKY